MRREFRGLGPRIWFVVAVGCADQGRPVHGHDEAFRLALARRRDLDLMADSEQRQLSQALLAGHRSLAALRLGCGRRPTSVPADPQILVADVVARLSVPVVFHHDALGLTAADDAHRDLGRVGVVSVDDEFGDRVGETGLHVRPEVLDGVGVELENEIVGGVRWSDVSHGGGAGRRSAATRRRTPLAGARRWPCQAGSARRFQSVAQSPSSIPPTCRCLEIPGYALPLDG